MEFEQMMLVYEHKTNGLKLVPNGVSILGELQVATILSEFTNVRMAKKSITSGAITIDIFKADLEDASKKAAITEMRREEVPWRVFLGHEWAGHSFEEIVILYLEPVVVKKAAASVAKR